MPVFGYDTAGGSHSGYGAYKMGTIHQMGGVAGNITTFHCAVYSLHETLKHVKLCVHNVDQSTHSPINKSLLEQVELELAISDDESIAAPEGNELLAYTYYLVGFISEHDDVDLKYDDLADEGFYKQACVYANEFTETWTVQALAWDVTYSIWVDYEEAGGGILGYNTPGGSTFGMLSSYQGNSWITDGVGGFVKNFHIAVAEIAGSEEVKMGICDCDQDVYNPSGKDVLEQTGAFVVEVSDNNVKAALGTTELAADTYYYICKAVSLDGIKIKYDNVPPGRWYKLGAVWVTAFINPLPTAFSFQSNIATFSIWLDYEPSSGGEVVRSIADTIGVTDTLLRSVVFTRKVPDSVGVSDILSRSITFIRNITDTINISDILTSMRTRIRKVTDVVEITDVLSYVATISGKLDSFGVSNIVQSIVHKNSRISEIKGNVKPAIREVKGIKK